MSSTWGATHDDHLKLLGWDSNDVDSGNASLFRRTLKPKESNRKSSA
jgi:hypothetical protein